MLLHNQPLLWTGPRRVGMLFYSSARSARRVAGHRASSVMRPEAFSIRLLPPTERTPDGQRLGEICIGAFAERFAVYPFAGNVESIAARWSDALRQLVDGADAVGLPTASNMTWIVYRSGPEVFVQQMLMLPGVGPRLLSGGTVGHIPAHRDANEDGQNVSQWATTVEAVAAFVAA